MVVDGVWVHHVLHDVDDTPQIVNSVLGHVLGQFDLVFVFHSVQLLHLTLLLMADIGTQWFYTRMF